MKFLIGAQEGAESNIEPHGLETQRTSRPYA
jgi:hypothetical protein